MTLAKADLCSVLYDEVGLNRRESKEFVELFFETICQTLEQGVSVKISGFGKFVVRDKTPRPGRNPKTGEEVPILARRVVTFRPSLKLKRGVAQNSFEMKQKFNKSR